MNNFECKWGDEIADNMQNDPIFCFVFYSKLQQQYERFSLAGLQFISRTISAKTSLTFILLRADASMNGQFQAWASASPSIVATSLWCSKSTLFPTNSNGTRSVPLTRVIWTLQKSVLDVGIESFK